MDSVIITGSKTTIAAEFRSLIDDGNIRMMRSEDIINKDISNTKRYLFCQGYLCGKLAKEQTTLEKAKSYLINYIDIKNSCNIILENIKDARICIIGSESAYMGSYDGVYAESKKLIHNYIEETKIREHQQLVGISPGIIEDAGMTTRRKDDLTERRNEHPMRRFLTSKEVAKMAYTLLYEQPYISGTIIRMNGGYNGC